MTLTEKGYIRRDCLRITKEDGTIEFVFLGEEEFVSNLPVELQQILKGPFTEEEDRK